MGGDRLHGGFCVGWFMALILDFGYVVVVLFVLRDLCRCWLHGLIVAPIGCWVVCQFDLLGVV